MAYLIDTNVISEGFRVRPDLNVARWLDQTPMDMQFVSVMTVAEMRRGLARMPEGRRKERLRNWLEVELRLWFGPRLLAITYEVADRWGSLAAQMGRSLPQFDSFIAATALHHDLAVVTRNVDDFRFPGLQVINPWEFE